MNLSGEQKAVGVIMGIIVIWTLLLAITHAETQTYAGPALGSVVLLLTLVGRRYLEAVDKRRSGR